TVASARGDGRPQPERELARADRFGGQRRAAPGRTGDRAGEARAQGAGHRQRDRGRHHRLRRAADRSCGAGRAAVARRLARPVALAGCGCLGGRVLGDRSWPDPARQVSPAGAPSEADARKLEGEQGMGASAREIERQIMETRERMDDNLNELEGRAASNAVRYGRIAAIVVAAVAVGAPAPQRPRCSSESGIGAAESTRCRRQTDIATLRDRVQRLVARAQGTLLARVVSAYGESRASSYALALAFAGFMAMFPMILGALAIIGLAIRDPATEAHFQSLVLQVFPSSAQPELQ